jgi:hypothetical protein
VKTEAKTPSTTPRKRGRKPGAAVKEDGTPTKKGKTSPTKAQGEKVKRAGMPPMPNSFETASMEDKMMLTMKDEGKSWGEIREAWQAMTGETVGGSTLAGRYQRIKANFVSVSAEDVSAISILIIYPPPRSYITGRNEGIFE